MIYSNNLTISHTALVCLYLLRVPVCCKYRNKGSVVPISPSNAKSGYLLRPGRHRTQIVSPATWKHYHKSTSLGNNTVGSCRRRRATVLGRDLHPYRRRLTSFPGAVRHFDHPISEVTKFSRQSASFGVPAGPV